MQGVLSVIGWRAWGMEHGVGEPVAGCLLSVICYRLRAGGMAHGAEGLGWKGLLAVIRSRVPSGIHRGANPIRFRHIMLKKVCPYLCIFCAPVRLQ